jgi:hypothetical protein
MNALQELTGHVFKIDAAIIAARVVLVDTSFDETKITLHDGHSLPAKVAFLQAIDIDYDNGYGSQWIQGTVWLSDGSWLERREYDGSEWWNHCTMPPLPQGMGLEISSDE